MPRGASMIDAIIHFGSKSRQGEGSGEGRHGSERTRTWVPNAGRKIARNRNKEISITEMKTKKIKKRTLP